MRYCLFFLFLLFISCQWNPKKTKVIENAPQHLNQPYVLLISIDGYRYDYTTRFKPPALTKFTQKGIQAQGLIPIFPSITFPNHYAIATGLRADKHGIVANTFWDPSRGELYQITDRHHVEDGRWYQGEPLWVAAVKQQMVAASYFWVGSEADVQGIRPHYWFRYDGATPNSQKVRQVLDWFRLPPKERPHLVTLYFPQVDKIGHYFGPNSREIRESVLDLDRSLKVLFEGLENLDIDVNVIVVSDHGMEESPPDKTIYLSDYIPEFMTKSIH